MEHSTAERLLEAAMAAREKAYSPLSGFCVGAALLTADGKIYEGCNIEVSGMTASCCAERSAMFQAVVAGERNFTAIAIVGSKAGEPVTASCAPCGVCRQVLAEFCNLEHFEIVLTDQTQKAGYRVYTLQQLLPLAFRRKDL